MHITIDGCTPPNIMESIQASPSLFLDLYTTSVSSAHTMSVSTAPLSLHSCCFLKYVNPASILETIFSSGKPCCVAPIYHKGNYTYLVHRVVGWVRKRNGHQAREFVIWSSKHFLCPALTIRESELTGHSFALSPSQSTQLNKQLAVKHMSPSDVANVCMCTLQSHCHVLSSLVLYAILTWIVQVC
jgi:hypothetical protein